MIGDRLCSSCVGVYYNFRRCGAVFYFFSFFLCARVEVDVLSGAGIAQKFFSLRASLATRGADRRLALALAGLRCPVDL